MFNCKTKNTSTGQTATELAIFGAILIFVLGLIIRTALNFNYVQNQTLGAMRLAFQYSLLGGDSSARSYTSVLFVEDRKDVDVPGGGRYDSSSRVPFIVSGSGSFTNTLFMPTFFGDEEALSISDMFINGQHFTFSTAGFLRYRLNRNVGHDRTYDRQVAMDYDFNQEGCTQLAGGCAKIYTKIASTDGRFCCDGSPACNEARDARYNGLYDRFDLDRNPATHCLDPNPGDGIDECPAGVDVPLGRSCSFSWQWHAVQMVPLAGISLTNGTNISLDVDQDLKEEIVLAYYNTDWDGDREGEYDLRRQREGFAEYNEEGGKKDKRAIAYIAVMDYQLGDMDVTYNTHDRQMGVPQPGLKQEVFLYSFSKTPTGEGTYLRIEQDKLFNNKQYVRDTRSSDRVDLIERQVQLSRINRPEIYPEEDTGRFCPGDPHFDPSNPVEACCTTEGCCYAQDKIYKTCFDRSSKILHVRSKVSGKTKKRWVTDISTDKNPFK